MWRTHRATEFLVRMCVWMVNFVFCAHQRYDHRLCVSHRAYRTKRERRSTSRFMTKAVRFVFDLLLRRFFAFSLLFASCWRFDDNSSVPLRSVLYCRCFAFVFCELMCVSLSYAAKIDDGFFSLSCASAARMYREKENERESSRL